MRLAVFPRWQMAAADERRRDLSQRVDELRAMQNRASKAIGGATGDEKQALIAEVSSVSAELKELEPQLAEAEASLQALLAATPNLPHDSAPDGFTEDDAVEIKRNHDAPPTFDFEIRDHTALGEALGMLDVERAVRTSGSRFVYLMGDIVLLQFALVRNALDVLVEEGFTPVIPPVLVREEAMYGTGFLPADEVNIYRIHGQASVEDYLKAIDYLVELIGIDHVALGTDFMEEIPAEIMMASLKGISAENLQKYYSSTLVEGFETPADFPGVTEGLLSRGYRPEEVKKIMGGNWLSLFEKVWSAA